MKNICFSTRSSKPKKKKRMQDFAYGTRFRGLSTHRIRHPLSCNIWISPGESRCLNPVSSFSFFNLPPEALSADSNPSTGTWVRCTSFTSCRHFKEPSRLHRPMLETWQYDRFAYKRNWLRFHIFFSYFSPDHFQSFLISSNKRRISDCKSLTCLRFLVYCPRANKPASSTRWQCFKSSSVRCWQPFAIAVIPKLVMQCTPLSSRSCRSSKQLRYFSPRSVIRVQ